MFYEELSALQRHDPSEYDALAFVTQHPDRPRPKREADQIFMLPGSQLTQVKLIAPYVDKQAVVFVGDGDCMALSLANLMRDDILRVSPKKLLVLDFDLRIVTFVKQLAEAWHLDDILDARYYNVFQAPPADLVRKFEVFYTNPPYGSKNDGLSGVAFLARGADLCQSLNSRGIAILPYASSQDWARKAMQSIQRFMLDNGYVTAEMLTGMHLYHLDDRPKLRSGTVVFDRIEQSSPTSYSGRALSDDETRNFYGETEQSRPVGIGLDMEFFYDEAHVPEELKR